MALPLEVEVLLPALALLPLAALITDSNGIVSWANAGFSDLTGYSGDEIVGQSVEMLESRAANHPIHDRLQRIASSEPWKAESIWSRKNGETHAVLIAVTPIKDTTGCTEHSLWVITTRARAEESLVSKAGQYSAVFSSMAEGVVFLDADGRIEACNESAERILGLTAGQIAGRTPMDPGWAAVHEDGSPFPGETHPVMETLRTGESLSNVVMGLHTPDGSLYWISINSRPLVRDGSLHGAVATFIDITERKRAEMALLQANESLAKAERHYRRIFDCVSDAVFVSTLPEDGSPGRFVQVNDQACGYLGYSRDELLHMGPYEITAPETTFKIKAIRESILTKGQGLFETINIAKGGKRIPAEVSAHIFDIDGIRMLLSSVRVITERKEAEAAKTKLEEQLRQAQKLESVGRLAGGVAHDFNNLLTVINGYSDLVLKRLKAPDLLRSYVEEIKKAGERAASVTKQLLAFSRKQMLEPRMLDLNTTIHDVVPMLQSVIGDGIALQLHLDNSLGQVMADPNQVHQVLMNLLVNARDAMPKGGKLEIATRNVDLDEDSAASHPEASAGRYILMTVTDSGRGMDEATCQHVFEPFFTTKESSKGSGLGLATVYGIIKQSDGWIDVRSEVGVGTSFMVYLPRMDGCPLVAENGIAAAMEGGGETILLVEDQEAVRSLAKAALRQHGYQVLEALDGAEAIDVAKRFSGEIHLLLTDVVMPGINGKELSERLIAMRPGLKVLFVSGYTANVIAHGGVIDQDIAYMAKPFSPDGLAAKVRKVLAAPAKPTVGT